MDENCILQGFYLQIHSSMMTYQLAFRTINTLDHLLSNPQTVQEESDFNRKK